MKIAIPVVNGKLCMHFGHCEHFAIVEVDQETNSVKDVQFLTPPPHAPGVIPAWVAEQQASMVIAGGMGNRAQQMFEERNVSVVTGAASDTPETIVKSWLDGTLEIGQNTCDH